MRSPGIGFTLASILSASIALAADAPSKSPDVQTIGGVTSVVSTTPVALPSPPPRVAAAVAPVPHAPEPGQRAKLAELVRLAAAPATLSDPFALANGKFPDFSSSIEGASVRPTPTFVLAPTGHPFAELLGSPFDPATAPKPAEIVTVGEPTGIDHALPAAPVAKSAKPAAHEPDIATTRPRDPAAPPPSPVKPAAASEVRR